MQPIINRPPNIDTLRYEPLPNPRYTIIHRIIAAITGLFRAIRLQFVEAEPRLNDRALEPLIIEEIQGIPRRTAIAARAAIPIQQRDPVDALALQIAAPDMEEYSKRNIIQAINAVPAQEKAEVIRNVILLITPDMPAFNRVNMIRAVALIPMNERDAAVALALQVITPDMEEYSRKNIIEAINAVPAQEKAEVIRNVILLITPDMPAFNRVNMIRAVALIPMNERDAAVALALQVITPDMEEYSRKNIIEAINAVPAQERADVIQYALQMINPQMYAHDRVMIIRNMANVHADQRANYVQQRRQGHQAMHARVAAEHGLADLILHAQLMINPRMYAHGGVRIIPEAPNDIHGARYFIQYRQVVDARAAAEHGVNVHEGNRDQQVRAAIELFYRHQGRISNEAIHQALQEFTQYLTNSQINAEHKQLARRALLQPKAPNETFGPLITENTFTVLGFEISGKELIGRLWIFASGLTEPDQTNAKNSMIFALKNSFDDMGSRLCNQGKTQRLVVGVLQGRLAGVDVELRPGMQVPTRQAVEMFFNIETHRTIERLELLVGAANRFCDENPAVSRDDFIREIREYARAQGLEN